MKVELEFTKSDCDLRLVRASFWDKEAHSNTAPKTELLAASEADRRHGSDKLFYWRSSVRAFCILLLRACATGNTGQTHLAGGQGSLARALVEVLRDKPKPNEPLTWAQRLFSPLIKQGANEARVPQTLFASKSNSDTNRFEVAPGETWKRLAIVILCDGKKVVATEELDGLALEIERQHESRSAKLRLPRLTGSIVLLAWESRGQQLLPIEQCGLPLPVNSGVALRIRLERPAFPYVMWINSRGRLQPLFPWKDFNWQSRIKPCSLSALSLPDAHFPRGAGFYPIESQPGVETALLLGSDTPAPLAVMRELETELQKLVSRFHPTLPEQNRIHFLTDPRTERAGRPAVRLGKPHLTTDPLAALREELVRLVGCSFSCVAGVSFQTTART